MIVPLKEHFEKNAGKTTEIIRHLIKHPFHGIIPAAAIYGTVAFGKELHPAHQMFREETKARQLNKQNQALGEIIAEMKKKNNPGPRPQRIIKPPLA